MAAHQSKIKSERERERKKEKERERYEEEGQLIAMLSAWPV